MRDTSCLRTRIALLACLPGLAGATLACNPPTKPQAVQEEDEATRKVLDARDRAVRGAERSTQLVPPSRRDELIISPEVRKRWEDEAKAQGKPLAEVAPQEIVDKIEQQDLRDKRKALAERKAAKARGELPTNKAAEDDVPQPDANPYGLFPGDPPFIDGYNPEEDTCVSGNWCGPAEAAMAVSVPNLPPKGDCPAKLTGGKGSELIESDRNTYAGLSAKPNMQGTFNEHGTELARERTGNETMCCYHWFEYCSGRPHLGDEGPVVATVRPGSAWSDDAIARGEPAALPQGLRERIAGLWRQDAQAEHASVAAFARATLELMALGAPPELLAQAQQAGLDEIDHARRCFSLAERYGAAPVQPGALPALAPRAPSLGQLAADTFAEGCVGETIAALMAQRSARDCSEATVREALEVIADDEARHAALAWSTVSWALREGGDEVTRALREVAAALRGPSRARPAADPSAALLAAHGRLDARAQAQASEDAWAELIEPMLASLLRTPAPAHLGA